MLDKLLSICWHIAYFLSRTDRIWIVVCDWLLAISDRRNIVRRHPEYTLSQAIRYVWPFTTGSFLEDVLDFDTYTLTKEDF